ncbi:mediator of RNA polymerase II transcription subunit 31 isoform X2 [Scaptodrosophila lebanonensis]|uniref:Mediator of RNA polymerase II transcription subunit 31 n=1 Tax=Drosophila lebanonensis TaxID=7225 RepID=A0A6J2TJW3_DROLE|nr:mediator of RNA polymerase II transcription subunit 31 isoform X2 [Scaptodrosophila lebanonensis]
MAKMYGKAAIESEEQQKRRWLIELEFVQCLSNPNYLNFLAQRGYFKDPSFINYLKYLQYWKEPEYAKYLMYPMCLYFLDLLQYEHFRREIVNSQCCKFIDEQAILQWQHYTRKRIKMMNSVGENAAAAAALQQSNGGIPVPSQEAATATGTEAANPQQQQQQQQTSALPTSALQNGAANVTQTQVSGGQQQQTTQRDQAQTASAQQQQINGLAAPGSMKLD